jgi:hypothetical protein
MADISKEINDFKNAIYGEEVRGSMITLAEKVNTEVETNTTNVNAAVSTANTASGKANQTLETAQEAINEAETTLQAANTAKADAQSSAEAAAASASAAEASKTATAQSAAAAAASAAEAEQVAEGLGGFNGSAASVTAVDTQGMVVETGENTNAQALFNALALKVAQELVSNEELAQQLASYVAKTDIVQTESTATNKVPSSAYLKTVKDTINSNLTKKYGRMRQLTSSDNLDNITDNGIYWYPTESVPQNAPYQNASVVEVIGSSSATGEKFQRVTRYGVPGKSSWRPLGGGSNGWLEWTESLTNADYNVQSFTNQYGLKLHLIKFGNDNLKAIRLSGYINKALTAGTEYIIASNVSLKSRVDWYHNVFVSGKGSELTVYLNIDNNGNVKITPKTAIASGTAINMMEYYV